MLDQHFADVLGADVGRAGPGEICVVRSARRESPEDDPGEGPTVPVWVLVTGGRGVVSSSHLLFRVAESWAEDFAAPEYLLRSDFLDDLAAHVARAMDCAVRVTRCRILMPGGTPSDYALDVHVQDIRAGETGPPRVPSAKTAVQTQLRVLRCADSDYGAARSALESGYVEYGRTVRFEVRR